MHTTGYQSGSGSVSISFLVNQPSSQPTQQPTSKPSSPSGQPTSRPSSPSGQPSRQPTGQPSRQPSSQPSRQPSSQPSSQPSRQPTGKPSSQPSRQPSSNPTKQPTSQPTKQPSTQPTTQPTVRISSSLKNGLVAYYPFDGNVNDNSGNGNHGMIRGGVSLVPDRFGNTKNAYSFDGNSGYVEIAGQQFNFVNNVSISFWVYPASTQRNWTGIIDKSHYTDRPNGAFMVHQIAGRTNDYVLCVSSAIGADDCHETDFFHLSASSWSHVIITKSGKGVAVYVNNGLVFKFTLTTEMIFSNGNAPLLLGAVNSGGTAPASNLGGFFNGKLDDVFFWTRLLTLSEMGELQQFDIPTSQPTGHFQNSAGSCIFSDQAISPGTCLISPIRRYKFCFGVDGSGCVTKYSNGASWCAFGPHTNPSSLNMQGDGDLVAYAQGGQPYFATETYNSDWRIGRQTFVTIQDNGNLVVYNTTNAPPNRVAWQCATQPSNPCPVTSLTTGTSVGELCSNQPTSQPSAQPSSQPSRQPTRQPSSQPSRQPYSRPSSQPSQQPSSQPTLRVPSKLKNGLVAYYPFDGNANDNSGNGNHGIPHGGVSLVSDRFGNINNAYSFDGSTGCISAAGHQFNLDYNMSFSVWVKYNVDIPWARVFDKCTFDNFVFTAGWSFEKLDTVPDQFYFTYANAPGVTFWTSSITITKNQWNHIVLLKKGKSVRFFVNGALAISSSFGNSKIANNGNLPFLIGAACGTFTNPLENVNTFFNGIIDDVFIYNRTLTDSEASLLYMFDSPTSQPSTQPTHQPSSQPSGQPSLQPTTQPTVRISSSLKNGLVAYYPFDGNANDNSGNGNHGVVHSAILTNDRFGNALNAYSFNGASYLEVPGQEMNFAVNMSFSLWMKFTVDNIPFVRVLDKCTFNNGNFQAGWTFVRSADNPNQFYYTYASSPTVNSASPLITLTKGVWYHVVLIKTAKSIRLYVNGVFVIASSSLSNPRISGNGNLPLLIGAGCTGSTPTTVTSVGAFFNGLIDDVFIYNRTLSENNIAELYGFYAPTSQPTSQQTGTPSGNPSSRPSHFPISRPSSCPTVIPSIQPTNAPSSRPTQSPTAQPYSQPSSRPTIRPSNQPSAIPSVQPISIPTCFPFSSPTTVPSNQPSSRPSQRPTGRPSTVPSSPPSSLPSSIPTLFPSAQPTVLPSVHPSSWPSSIPSVQPSNQPSADPTNIPSSNPSFKLSRSPTLLPTGSPSDRPSSCPSTCPTRQPTSLPTCLPSGFPTTQPSRMPSSLPSSQPISRPTGIPSETPSFEPSVIPSGRPSTTPIRSLPRSPTIPPTKVPTKRPIRSPSSVPSSHPTAEPTSSPSNQPTNRPTGSPVRTKTKTPVTSFPSSQPSRQPTGTPSHRPSFQPVSRPSAQPSRQPTSRPSRQPITHPTDQPSRQPTSQPSNQPTARPSSSQPTSTPTLASSAPTPVPAPSVSAAPSTTKRPTRMPTVKPTMKPSVSPTVYPTVTPTATPSAVPTAAPTNALSVLPVGGSNNFRGTLFLFGSSSASSTPDTSNIYLNNFLASQRSFIIFGQEKDKIQSNLQIGSRASHGFYAEISSSSSSGTGMSRDSASRSITVVGDLNNDGFDDLVVGFPYASTCFVYLGSSANGFFQNLIVSFAIYGLEEDEFGWSVSRAGDMNFDNYQEMIIYAKIPGICYVFFGKPEFISDIYIRDMTSSDGFRIISSTSATINFGMAVDSAGDFNNDGWNDLVISAMSFTTQGIVYIVLGRPAEKLNEDIIIENALPSTVFNITTPPFSFAALSLAGIGDLNNDGFADIAIGSIPYQGGYSIQRTYIIYGRRSATGRGNSLDINEMIIGEDGFTVIGGGFLVAGIGDVNQDGIADCMISSYYNWQSKGNAYLMNYPRNMTSSPTFLPSSLPSSHPSTSPSSVPSETAITYTPSNQPSVGTSPPVELVLRMNESASPSYTSTVKPTKSTNNPTVKKTPIPSIAPTTKSPTRTPTVIPSFPPTRKPIVDSLSPSLIPTVIPKTRKPSFLPTREPTSNQIFSIDGSSFDVVTFDTPGEYIGASNTNQIFVPAAPGVYRILTRPPGHGKSNHGVKDVKMVSLVPVSHQRVIVDGFDVLSDILDLTKYHTIQSLADLSYTTNPLVIKLPITTTTTTTTTSSASVSSHEKVFPAADSTASSPSTSPVVGPQEQTVTLTSFPNLNSFSENNFLFISQFARPDSSPGNGKPFSSTVVISFVVILTVVAFVFFLKCIREDIIAEEKEKEMKKKLREDDEPYERAEDEEEQSERRKVDEENQLHMVTNVPHPLEFVDIPLVEVKNHARSPKLVVIHSHGHSLVESLVVSSSEDSASDSSEDNLDENDYQSESFGSWILSEEDTERSSQKKEDSERKLAPPSGNNLMPGTTTTRSPPVHSLSHHHHNPPPPHGSESSLDSSFFSSEEDEERQRRHKYNSNNNNIHNSHGGVGEDHQSSRHFGSMSSSGDN
jgi:hypothetical protein